MEKTTKKKKKTKGMKKRIGIIAVGGLSLVLTICLSVGATLAWFAGSTWSSNQMFMGGPVYVEMAGLGKTGGTAGGGSGAEQTAAWKGGAGNLHIQAATTRTTGTVTEGNTAAPANVLLPGQKFEIYSQARVFSTAKTTTIGTDEVASGSNGANVTNTSKNGEKHVTDKGKVTTTTTSVLRARFSVSVEFDPTVGFNNFTNESYHTKYPAQSAAYTGDNTCGTMSGTTPTAAASLAWDKALANSTDNKIVAYEKADGNGAIPANARRDAVISTKYTADLTTQATLEKIKTGELKSIYSWKFVTYDVWNAAGDLAASSTGDTAQTSSNGYIKMAKPFDGSVKTGKNGFYGVWILKDGKLKESDAFYKERCNSYIDSYVEEYITEYGEVKTRTIGDSLAGLETSLNQSFVNLVNDASDNIIAGNVFGMTASNGIMTYAGAPSGTTYTSGTTNASWLYIDPSIGHDTNTNELSTSTGGWWYLVECDNGSVKNGNNQVYITYDQVAAQVSGNSATNVNTPYAPKTSGGAAFVPQSGSTPMSGDYFKRSTYGAANEARKFAKLYEIDPLMGLSTETFTYANGNSGVTKVVSYSFPFVNGTSALPGDALTNVFANAKITIQISFQALQAFLPYSADIDNMDYTNPLLGTAKALNIANAIPIFNEAFDYQEASSADSVTNL